MVTQYASGRQLLPVGGSTFVVTNDGNLGVTGTYYVGLIAENRVGYSLTSTLTAITLTSTSKLTVTLPALLDGEDWQNIIIGASLTNDITTLTQIASVNKLDFSTPLELTTNQLFKLTLADRTVANPAALPATPEQGLCRYVTSTNSYYKYDKYSDKTVDNINVLNATTGRWLRIGSISTYQDSTTNSGGCDVDVRNPNLTVITPNYLCDGSLGDGVIYWLRNDGNDNIPSGTRISCLIRLGDEDYSQRFSGMFELEIIGYVNLTTAVLNTTTSSDPITYDSKTEWLTLSEDLEPNNAVAVKVSPRFRAEQLDGAIPYNAAISAYLQFSPTTGIYTPGVFGNLIYQDRNKWRIVPNVSLSVTRLAGSGIVAKQELNDLSDYTITGLTANTSNQNIFLSSNGTAFVSISNTLEGVAKRAVVSTVNGIGIATSYGNVNLDNTKQLSITVNYPTAIRSDYPDPLIAGLNKGIFNADNVAIYIKNSSNQYFKVEKIITPNATIDSWIINYSEFSSAALPNPSTNFGLYKPTTATPTTTNTSSTFPTDSYEVLIAFVYSNAVTVIDHSVSELYEITADLQTIFETVATVWYSDNGVPDELLGENGAYYLNYDNADIYKKVNDTWVLDGNIAVITPSFGTIAVAGQDNIVADNSSDTLTIEAGSGITLTTNATTDTLTITSNAANNTFSTFAVSGQSDVVADSSSDTLTLVAGTGMTITTNATTDSITFESSGVSATVDIGAVTIVNPDQLPTVINSGTTSDAILDFELPSAPSITLGTVTTGAAGSSVIINDTGTDGNVIYNFTIPRGDTGSVSSASDLTLTEVGSSPTTTTNEIKLYNLNNAPTIRLESNGTALNLAATNVTQSYTATQYGAPSVQNISGSVTLDGTIANIFILTLIGNVTDLTMNNVQTGATYIIYLIEDATGGRTVSLNSIFKRITGDTSTINTAANKINILTGIARSSSAITLFPIAVEV